MSKEFPVFEVDLEPLPLPLNGEISEKVYCKCSFCEKNYILNDIHEFYLNKLSGSGFFYCSFCLRNNFHNKTNKDILLLSFRGIISYFYFKKFPHNMWLSEIENYIETHAKVGMLNPLFRYDPETFLWFIDFSKVGDTKRKIPIEEVYKTLINILLTFNLYELNINTEELYLKYKAAIDLFYKKRYRPLSRKILNPTILSDNESLDIYQKSKNFIFSDLKFKKI